MVALSETRFLVLEQGADTTAAAKYHIDIFEIDLSPATNVTAVGADGMVIGGKTLAFDSAGSLAMLPATPVASCPR